MSLRDLFVKFQIDLQGAEKIDAADKAMKKAKSSALDLGEAFKALGALWLGRKIIGGIRDFIQGTIQQADALDHQAEALGLTTDQLQKYQYAASLVGVTAQQAAVGFRFFNRVVGEAEFGTKGALKTLGRLGIQIYDAGGKVRPTNDLLMDFADHLAKIPDQQKRTALAMSTLGRSGAALLPFLQKGSKALKEMFADVEELGGGFDREFIEQAHEMDVQQKRLAMGWRTMGVELMRVLLPAMRLLVERGIRTVKTLIDTARHTNAVKTALLALGATAVAVGAVVAAAWAPEIAVFLLLAEAVFRAYLVFDDFYTFLQGGQSTIGDTLDKAGVDSKNLAAQMREDFHLIAEALGLVIGGANGARSSFDEWFHATLPKIVQFSGLFLTGVVEVVDFAVLSFKALARVIIGVGGALAALATGKGFTGFDRALDEQFAKMGSESDEFQKRKEVYGRLRAGFDQIGNSQGVVRPVAPAVPGMREVNPNYQATADEQNPGRTTGGGGVVTTNHVTVSVNATGATNPAAVGNAVAKGVRQGLKNPDSTNRNTFDAVSSVSPVGVGG